MTMTTSTTPKLKFGGQSLPTFPKSYAVDTATLCRPLLLRARSALRCEYDNGSHKNHEHDHELYEQCAIAIFNSLVHVVHFSQLHLN